MKQVEKFVPPSPLKIAVLFLVFNRPDTTKLVFEEIRKAKPPRLYIVADGPRENIISETEKVKAVRDYVMANIDWDCEVKTLFREKNLGCGKAVSEAITWFFENEEMGIILEDDCLPSQSFFWFCEELLERYKDDKRVGMISGDNFQNGIKRGDADYYFSIYNHIWGWASWSDRWSNYDAELKHIEDSYFIEKLFTNKKAVNYWKTIFKKMKKKEIDTWDYQWTFTLWKNRQLTILPNLNLISNIGFNQEATHTKELTDYANLKRYEFIVDKHPEEVAQDLEADDYTFEKHFAIKPFHLRAKNKLKREISKLKDLLK